MSRIHEYVVIVDSLYCLRSVQKFEDYESAIPPLDRNVARLLDDIAALVPREWETISAVFPNAPAVLQLFLQRIFIQTVDLLRERLMGIHLILIGPILHGNCIT